MSGFGRERILVVEDDQYIADLLKRILEKEGYTVKTASNGAEGLFMASSNSFDLIVLDVMLPELDGFSVCSALRDRGINVPVLMLTVKDSVDDKVEGLSRGADDYLTKPFSIEELLARVKALLRRFKGYKNVLKVADLELDPVSRRVRRAGVEIELSPKEFDILELLVRNMGKVIGERAILKEVWGLDCTKSNILKVYMHHLRQKVDRGFDKKLIRTVRGVGYMIDVS